MEPQQLLITVILSLGLVTAILGFSWWLIKTSKEEAKTFKGIPKSAMSWIRASKLFGWVTLASFILLCVYPSQKLSGIFLIAFGLYALVKSIGMWKAQTVYLVKGPRLYGKSAKIVAVIDIIFGSAILALGLAGLLLPN
jgi:hypothetical protein